ncbi:MAG: transcriptional regulator [Pseudomonadota bacterium]|nr:transcriptional regulator [Pseudomonadota bacterium]
MTIERRQFSERLAAALRNAGYEPRAATLHRLFNSRYAGRSVSYQTSLRWLSGQAIPEQDKLQVLALMLGITPQWLRYGSDANKNQRAPLPLDNDDEQILRLYLALPGDSKFLVARLIRKLSHPEQNALGTAPVNPTENIPPKG